MANPQFKDVVAMLLKSPQGLLALIVATGTFAALIYLFVFRSPSTKSPSAAKSRAKRSPGKSATQDKLSPSKNGLSKTSPSKSAATNASPHKETTAASKSPKVKTPSERKSEPSKTAASSPRQVTTARMSTAERLPNSGEWITVNKKKPRPAKKVSSTSEQTSGPQTRMSTRQSSQGAKRT